MPLSNNLQYLRKKHNMTQEELADYLGVSRQSISKWETGEAYPETDKIIALCDKFNLSMDKLVRGDITDGVFDGKNTQNDNDFEDKTNFNDTNADTIGYKKHMQGFAVKISLGVLLVLMGVSLGVFIAGFESGNNVFAVIAGATILLFVSVAVFLFVFAGISHENFKNEHPYIDNLFTEDQIKNFNKKFTMAMACLVSLIIVVVVALMVAGLIIELKNPENTDLYYTMAVAVFLFELSILVGFIVYFGINKSMYEYFDFNKQQEIEKDEKTLKNEKLANTLCPIVMLTATAIFLSLGFLLDLWHPSWIVFPIGGILCGIINIVLGTNKKSK